MFAAGEGVLTLVDSLVMGCAVLIVMSTQISWQHTLLALLPMPLMALAIKRNGDALHERFRVAQAAFSSLNDRTQESLTSIRMIKAFGLEDRQSAQFAADAADTGAKNMRVARIDARFDPTIYIAIGAANLLAIGGGSWMVIHGSLTLGQLTSFVMYLGLMIWPMLALAWMFNIVERGSAAYGRIRTMLEEAPAVDDGTEAVPAGRGVLQVAIRDFIYPQASKPSLEQVNFTLQPGQMLGICGPTGAGKSTILALLQRHFDVTHGEIRFHDLPLPILQLDSWRARLAVVNQTPFLFSDTVANNIALGKPDATQAQIERVAQLASVHDDILRLPQGYETEVGERGVMLSGGQKQRISIARALLLEAEILILDDALSAVDGRTEHQILHNLRQWGEGGRSLSAPTACRRSPRPVKFWYCSMGILPSEAATRRWPCSPAGTATCIDISSWRPRSTRFRRRKRRPWMRSFTELWPTLKRLLAYGSPWRKPLAIAVAMMWIAAAAEVSGPLLISYFIDNMVAKHTLPLKLVAGLAVAYIGLQLLAALLHYNQSLLFNRAAVGVVQQLRSDVMDAALHQPLSEFDTQPVGQLISRVTNDTEVIRDLYVTVVATVLRSAALIGAMLVAMFSLDWRMALVAIAIFPAVLIVMIIYQRYSTPIVRRVRAWLADINDGFNEVINGMGVIQQFRQQARFGERMREASYAHYLARMQTLRLDGFLLRPLLSLFSSLVLCGLLMLFGFSAVGTIEVGVLYAFISYLGRLNEPLIELTTQQSMLQQAVVAGERVFELMDRPRQAWGADDAPLSSGRVEIDHLSFAYRGDRLVLQDITLDIPSRSLRGAGRTYGSGKSTLASLMMGLLPVNPRRDPHRWSTARIPQPQRVASGHRDGATGSRSAGGYLLRQRRAGPGHQ
ncbi:putative multidrug transporter membrane\ATP-binding components [Klebsiella pneumoniae subsp. ozaenae]|uniref:Putative multidrug transporter membrane\ATP-binding components n=25 Tax=Bacteria TaxID=2 RepID=A0A378BZ90_KLEPO|nr:putative multidrug transporter membrane\ATP-binding components [Klebsiella pneumoniae subsp. ozaenae]